MNFDCDKYNCCLILITIMIILAKFYKINEALNVYGVISLFAGSFKF